MPAEVRISQAVANSIREVQPPIVEEVQQHLIRLGEKPRLGTPQVSGQYEGTLAYEFRVNRLPLSRVFTLVYAFDQTADRIEVLAFGVRDGVPLRLAPASFRVDRPDA